MSTCWRSGVAGCLKRYPREREVVTAWLSNTPTPSSPASPCLVRLGLKKLLEWIWLVVAVNLSLPTSPSVCASALTLNPFPLVCIDSNYLNHFFFPLNYSSLSAQLTFNTFFFSYHGSKFFTNMEPVFSKLGAVIRKKEECCSVDLCFSLCFFKQSFISSALCSSLFNQKRRTWRSSLLGTVAYHFNVILWVCVIWTLLLSWRLQRIFWLKNMLFVLTCGNLGTLQCWLDCYHRLLFSSVCFHLPRNYFPHVGHQNRWVG